MTFPADLTPRIAKRDDPVEYEGVRRRVLRVDAKVTQPLELVGAARPAIDEARLDPRRGKDIEGVFVQVRRVGRLLLRPGQAPGRACRTGAPRRVRNGKPIPSE